MKIALPAIVLDVPERPARPKNFQKFCFGQSFAKTFAIATLAGRAELRKLQGRGIEVRGLGSEVQGCMELAKVPTTRIELN